jgi:exosome complex component RRP43
MSVAPPAPTSSEVSTFARLHPLAYHREFLSHGVRADGRALHHARHTLVAKDSITTSVGSALVKVGNTSVVCATKLEVGKPGDVKPQDGRLGEMRRGRGAETRAHAATNDAR